MKYYRFRFQPPESGRSSDSSDLQDIVVGLGIIATMLGAMLTGSANTARGDLNLYTGGMISFVFFFALMAMVSENYPRAARWLIIVPASFVELLLLHVYVVLENLVPALLATLIITSIYFLIVGVATARQLARISGDIQ